MFIGLTCGYTYRVFGRQPVPLNSCRYLRDRGLDQSRNWVRPIGVVGAIPGCVLWVTATRPGNGRPDEPARPPIVPGHTQWPSLGSTTSILHEYEHAA